MSGPNTVDRTQNCPNCGHSLSEKSAKLISDDRCVFCRGGERMSQADYHCPACDAQLANAGAANVWKCTRDSCQRVVVEVVDETRHRVREFYRRATDHWEGLRG